MNGQNPVSESPFCARGLMMGANDGAIDHLQGVRDGPAVVQGLKDILPQARKCPATKLPVNA